MQLFHKIKTRPGLPYDPETQQPALRSSICTGEMTVGFLDRRTGQFHAYELARSEADVERFCKQAGIPPEQLKRIY